MPLSTASFSSTCAGDFANGPGNIAQQLSSAARYASRLGWGCDVYFSWAVVSLALLGGAFIGYLVARRSYAEAVERHRRDVSNFIYCALKSGSGSGTSGEGAPAARNTRPAVVDADGEDCEEDGEEDSSEEDDADEEDEEEDSSEEDDADEEDEEEDEEDEEEDEDDDSSEEEDAAEPAEKKARVKVVPKAKRSSQRTVGQPEGEGPPEDPAAALSTTSPSNANTATNTTTTNAKQSISL